MGCEMGCEPAETFVPATDVQLDQVVALAGKVEERGVAGAPAEAFAVAASVRPVVLELQMLRRAGPPSAEAMNAVLWRERALRAETALEAACCSGCGQVLASREVAAVHVQTCAQHPLGRVILGLRARIADLEQLLGPRPVPAAVNPAAEDQGPVIVPDDDGQVAPC